jgi:hypothetical protein
LGTRVLVRRLNASDLCGGDVGHVARWGNVFLVVVVLVRGSPHGGAATAVRGVIGRVLVATFSKVVVLGLRAGGASSVRGCKRRAVLRSEVLALTLGRSGTATIPSFTVVWILVASTKEVAVLVVRGLGASFTEALIVGRLIASQVVVLWPRSRSSCFPAVRSIVGRLVACSKVVVVVVLRPGDALAIRSVFVDWVLASSKVVLAVVLRWCCPSSGSAAIPRFK